MDTLYKHGKTETANSKVLLAAIGAAILIVAVLIGFYATRPAYQDKKQQILEGAFLEGTPEFEAISKKIAIQNDSENTYQSMTGLGTITMFTRSKVRNMSDKTIVALEVKVGVLDQFDKVIREKKQIVLPNEKFQTLAPNTDMPINVPVEGFSKEDDRARVRWKVTAIKVEQ